MKKLPNVIVANGRMECPPHICYMEDVESSRSKTTKLRKKVVVTKRFWKINAFRPEIKAKRGRMRKFKLGLKANRGGLVKELGCQIVTQLIIDRYKHLQEDKLVFGKMNYWSMCKKLKTVMTACGIEKAISYHCGRHSFATLALSKGMPIESVSRVLGHTNIVTTQIYAKITSQKLDNDNSSSPLRESVVRIKPNTTMDDLMTYAQKVYERWGVRAIQSTSIGTKDTMQTQTILRVGLPISMHTSSGTG